MPNQALMHTAALGSSITVFLLASGCATSGTDGKSTAELQAQRVGAPVFSKAESCDSEMTRRIMPRPSREVALAGKDGWVNLTYDLDGSGNAVNAAIVQQSTDPAFGQAALRALQSTKFKEGVVRQGCKQQFTVSFE